METFQNDFMALFYLLLFNKLRHMEACIHVGKWIKQ